MAIAFIQLTIIALVIAGLIFRTKETLGLLLIGGMLTLIAAHPVLGLSAVAATIAIGIIMKKREERHVKALDDPDQE